MAVDHLESALEDPSAVHWTLGVEQRLSVSIESCWTASPFGLCVWSSGGLFVCSFLSLFVKSRPIVGALKVVCGELLHQRIDNDISRESFYP